MDHDIQYRAPGDLAPNPHNARVHDEDHVRQLTRAIEEWGFTIPVLIDGEDTIIAGHGRVMAAQEAGLDQVPVLVADGWTEEQKRAYVIADNKLALSSDWNIERLAAELEGIQADGLELTLTGFTDDDLKRIQDDLDEAYFDEQGDGDTGSDEGGDEEDEDEGDVVSFHCPMQRDHRNRVYEALREAKDRHQVDTSGEALFAIVEEWLNARR